MRMSEEEHMHRRDRIQLLIPIILLSRLFYCPLFFPTVALVLISCCGCICWWLEETDYVSQIDRGIAMVHRSPRGG